MKHTDHFPDSSDPHDYLSAEELQEQTQQDEYQQNDDVQQASEPLKAETGSYIVPVILVIEDEQPLRESLHELLNIWGYEVLEAGHGVEGLEIMRNQRPDLVLCDVMMPQMDGYTLLEHVRQDAELSEIPIIMLSARVDRKEVRRGMNLGARDYIPKPFTASELMDAIESKLQDLERSRKKRQSQGEKMEELFQTVENRDKFFSIVAHDLRSPLLNMKFFVQQFRNDLQKDPQLSPMLEKLDFTNTLEQSVNSLTDFVENLLNWARVQNRTLKYNPECFQLRTLLGRVTELFADLLRNKKITLINTVAEDVEVFADENMTKLILTNLVSNAIKYCYEGGHILIQSEQVEDDFWAISVIDDGMGMAPETVEKIFSSRDRDRDSTPGTMGEQGTGLGLSVVKEFVKINEGDLEVQSSPGSGTRFTFTLPPA